MGVGTLVVFSSAFIRRLIFIMATEIDPTSFSAANRNALKSAIESLLSENTSDTETLTEEIMSFLFAFLHIAIH